MSGYSELGKRFVFPQQYYLISPDKQDDRQRGVDDVNKGNPEEIFTMRLPRRVVASVPKDVNRIMGIRLG